MEKQLVTLEQLEQYHAAKVRQQRREYNKRHPEIILKQRIRSAANLLRKHGFTVINPNEQQDHAQEQRQGVALHG